MPASTTRAATPCSSPTSPTSGTSPGSPGRPRCCSSGPTSLVFVTDGRYRDQAADADRGGRRATPRSRSGSPPTSSAAHLVDRSPSGTRARARGRGGDLGATAPLRGRLVPRRPTWSPTEGLVEELRRVKDAGEVARIEAACAIADAALAAVRHRLGEGADRGRGRPRARAADAPPRRRRPVVRDDRGVGAERRHAAPPGRRRAGSSRATSWSSTSVRCVDGYHSDMTRTVMVGEPTATQRRMLDAVHGAQAAGVAAVRPGVDASEVDEACRSVLRRGRLGRRVRARHRPRRRASTSTRRLGCRPTPTATPGRRPRRHRRARRLPRRARRGPHRGHGRGHRRGLPHADAGAQGARPSRPTRQEPDGRHHHQRPQERA